MQQALTRTNPSSSVGGQANCRQEWGLPSSQLVPEPGLEPSLPVPGMAHYHIPTQGRMLDLGQPRRIAGDFPFYWKCNMQKTKEIISLFTQRWDWNPS